MLDLASVLAVFKKYNYDSITGFPYIYKKDDLYGILYSFIDDIYGEIVRVRFLDSIKGFENFLKKYSIYEKNKSKYNLSLKIDSYNSDNPKLIFIKDGKVLSENELFNLENYEQIEKEKLKMDQVSLAIYEVGDLLLFYNEIKALQADYFNNLTKLKNRLREKYLELQKEVDLYNDVEANRIANYLPNLKVDDGVNQLLENSIKDKYHQYLSVLPSYEDACILVKEVWDLLKALELNEKFFEAKVEDFKIRNELKRVESKIEFVKDLNSRPGTFKPVDLKKKFVEINEKTGMVDDESINKENEILKDKIEKKYMQYEEIDIFSAADYLKESYDFDYVETFYKYSKNGNYELPLPINDVIASLNTQYVNGLNVQMQTIMAFINSRYNVLYDTILSIPNFYNIDNKSLLKILNKNKGFTKAKAELFSLVSELIKLPVNETISKQLFYIYDYSSFNNFFNSLVNTCKFFMSINTGLFLNSDIILYTIVNDKNELKNMKLISLSNNLGDILEKKKKNNGTIYSIMLKKGTPVFYSPYYVEFGDLYSKESNQQIVLKQYDNINIIVKLDDIDIIEFEEVNKVNKCSYSLEEELELQICNNINVDNTIDFKKAIVFKKNK